MPFTFIRVHYKHGEWSARHYDTLREGLNAECTPEERKLWRKASDDDLIEKLFTKGIYIWIHRPALLR